MAVDIRCSFPADDWKKWELPGDKNAPDTLRRIVREWAALQGAAERLRPIDSNLDIALGKLLAIYELSQSHGLPSAVEQTPTPPAPPAFLAMNDDL